MCKKTSHPFCTPTPLTYKTLNPPSFPPSLSLLLAFFSRERVIFPHGTVKFIRLLPPFTPFQNILLRLSVSLPETFCACEFQNLRANFITFDQISRVSFIQCPLSYIHLPCTYIHTYTYTRAHKNCCASG